MIWMGRPASRVYLIRVAVLLKLMSLTFVACFAQRLQHTIPKLVWVTMMLFDVVSNFRLNNSAVVFAPLAQRFLTQLRSTAVLAPPAMCIPLSMLGFHRFGGC